MARKILMGLDLNGKQITSLADPSSPTDAATKQYVDNTAQAVNDLKDPVRAATTANVALTGLQSIDGVALAAGDRVLVKANTDGTENGLYVAATGAWTRATDADSNTEVTRGFATTVLEGTTKGTGSTTPNPVTWILNVTGAITIGTTALTFSPIGGVSATAKAAGSGLVEDGNSYSVGGGNGILVDADGIRVDPSIVARKFAADCAATTNPQTFAHGLGSRDVDVAVRLASTHELVLADVVMADANSVTVNFGGSPSAGQYRVVIIG